MPPQCPSCPPPPRRSASDHPRHLLMSPTLVSETCYFDIYVCCLLSAMSRCKSCISMKFTKLKYLTLLTVSRDKHIFIWHRNCFKGSFLAFEHACCIRQCCLMLWESELVFIRHRIQMFIATQHFCSLLAAVTLLACSRWLLIRSCMRNTSASHPWALSCAGIALKSQLRLEQSCSCLSYD